MNSGQTLAQRLGMTTHRSLLDRRIRALAAAYPSTTAGNLEDWLLDVANARGARLVCREPAAAADFRPPSAMELPDEELIGAICLLQRQDRPQLLRLAGQLISRGKINMAKLIRLARRERFSVILGEMARQAIRVEPEHPAWRALDQAFPAGRRLRSPIIHWQRLAWPVMTARGYNAASWHLVK